MTEEQETTQQGDQAAETTEQEQTEQTVSSETTEQGAAEPEKTVPYSRFREVYGKQKQAERDAEYWKTEAQRNQAQPAQNTTETQTGEPQPGQFDDYNDYVKAQTKWEVAQARAQDKAKTEQAQARERQQQFFGKISEGVERYDDFEDVVFNPSVPITEAVVEALHDCDHAADIAYHLAKDPQEAHRIASLPPVAAAREIGKLEAKYSGGTQPSQKSTTNAPAPTSPVGSSETPTKKLEDMTTEEYIAYRNQQEFGA